ncbi:hypothetical protein GVN16_10465 [Emticicia sp. CRIBPO]|uniref:hypothetical protein n=1 Tax=Emticicia sp. CRIBPO TaxID=2683258 RepID=UPI001412AA0E|nr:hypothetical protein [Emticicia sp. CRIBPO]NBA86186.1 hypothetical protein [Emticicia sp. CRIBPO]
MNIINIRDLVILRKALILIKWGGDEDLFTEVASSPYIGEILDQITDELEKEFGNGQKSEWGNIEKYPKSLEKIRWHIKNITSWEKLDKNVKSKTITNLAYPYKINEDTILTLIDLG